MTKPIAANAQREDRLRANRLRKLSTKITGMGKRTLVGMLEAGEALEEAAGILKGRYSAWVLAECRIDARTALGYRKTFRVLGDRREWLEDAQVAPSVALAIACAKPDGRKRALAALENGRTLTVAETKLIIRGETSIAPSKPARDALIKLLRAFCNTFLAEVDRMVAMARVEDTDEFRLGELVARARVLAPMVKALQCRTAGGDLPAVHPIYKALTDLAEASSVAEMSTGAAELIKAASPDIAQNAEDVVAGPAAGPLDAVRSSGIRSIASTFKHGLTALEICAGAGGQAAGLSKAGFRHIALIERGAAACETLRAAFGPEHVVQADLVGYDPGDIGDVDLLAGGVPCQPYSQAGERRGAADNRDLFPEALRLVERLRPRALMLENVTGIFDPGNDIHRFGILTRLRRMGYASEWQRVDASHFGVPQKRVRAILVAFRERKAMRRFRWPKAFLEYAREPHVVISSLDGHLRARGWEVPVELQDRMDRTAPTVMGGSEKKQGIDFGQRKSSAVWAEMGFVRTRFGHVSPAIDHKGDVVATLPMLATLQGFPHDWPFRGSRRDIFRQVGNALPPAVALHLGCAIAHALTGEAFDPADQYAFEGMRSIHLPKSAPSNSAEKPETARRGKPMAAPRVRLPLERLGNNVPTWVADDVRMVDEEADDIDPSTVDDGCNQEVDLAVESCQAH